MEADFNDMVKRLQDPMLNEKDKRSWSKRPRSSVRKSLRWNRNAADLWNASLNPFRNK